WVLVFENLVALPCPPGQHALKHRRRRIKMTNPGRQHQPRRSRQIPPTLHVANNATTMHPEQPIDCAALTSSPPWHHSRCATDRPVGARYCEVAQCLNRCPSARFTGNPPYSILPYSYG